MPKTCHPSYSFEKAEEPHAAIAGNGRAVVYLGLQLESACIIGPPAVVRQQLLWMLEALNNAEIAAYGQGVEADEELVAAMVEKS